MKTINYYDEYFDHIEKPHLKNNHGEDYKRKLFYGKKITDGSMSVYLDLKFKR